uniref:Sodium:neurotransmitter symporter domain containing protein n=1 Tax=Haemonchus contortus TaxID=6289 RepID=A0A912LYW6_HAECO
RMTDDSRGAWGNQIQFVLTCIGFSVGLGNLWRFPAMAYENGGAAFLIPYVTCSVLVGLPCLYLEFFIGQSTQSGPSKAFWYFMPALQGIGWAMSILSLLTGIYYNLVVAWCLRYIFDVITFQSSKWTSCDNYWNSETCQSINGSVSAVGDNTTFAAQEFFRYRLFKMSATPDQFGMFNWEMFVALLIAWIITCLSIVRGVSVIGKISFLTATLPYVIIVIMFIRGVTMDGAKIGIDYYLLKPDMSKVFRLKTWLEAAKQLCFSLSIGFGGLLALASFNKKDHNCFRDAIVVTICDSLMSIIGGLPFFRLSGHLSKSSGKPIDVLFKYDAPSITFVTYPQAISTMPVPELFALLLFFMFFLLGISSQFGTTQTIVTTLTDQFPAMRRWNRRWS